MVVVQLERSAAASSPGSRPQSIEHNLWASMETKGREEIWQIYLLNSYKNWRILLIFFKSVVMLINARFSKTEPWISELFGESWIFKNKF